MCAILTVGYFLSISLENAKKKKSWITGLKYQFYNSFPVTQKSIFQTEKEKPSSACTRRYFVYICVHLTRSSG